MLAQVQNHAVVIYRIADTVDCRHRRHDNHILPLQQRFGGREAHLLDLIVDAGILLDIHIARRYVSLGLVIIVVGNKIFHRVFRKEIAQLRIQLRRQCLIWRHHHRRPSQLRDDISHGKRLAGAGHTEQCLERQPLVDSLHQLRDGRRLVARRFERLVQAIGAVGKGYDVHGEVGIVRAKTRSLTTSLQNYLMLVTEVLVLQGEIGDGFLDECNSGLQVVAVLAGDAYGVALNAGLNLHLAFLK